MSDRYALIGHPVAHSKSPRIHARFARDTGQDLEYGLIEAPLDGFAAAVDAFRAGGGRGLNVTLPFKEQAFRYCARVGARATQVVNTLVFDDGGAYGDNTDGVGLVRDLQVNVGVALQNQRVVLMGAGGAAQGVVGALLEADVASLVVANRTLVRAQALAARHPGVAASAYETLEGRADVVINATSAGLAGGGPSLPRGVLGPGTLAYDMVYGRDTAFLAAARAAGARACDGLGMLVEQAAESFHLWRGVRPETAPVLRELRGA
jgi:shikimate dehydrogenase